MTPEQQELLSAAQELRALFSLGDIPSGFGTTYDTFTIKDRDMSDDGPEGETGRATTGFFWSVSGDEAGADQIKAMGKHRLAVPLTVAIEPTDTVTDSAGHVYSVKYVFPLTAFSINRIIGLEDA